MPALFRQAVPEATGREKPVRVELIVEGIGGHRFARAGRVHETLLPDIDSHVIDPATPDFEEHEIAAPQFARFDAGRLFSLLARSARHAEAQLPMRVEHEATAIETIERRTAITVWRATQAEREIRECFAAIAHAGRTTCAVPVARVLRGWRPGEAPMRRLARVKRNGVRHHFRRRKWSQTPALARRPRIADLRSRPSRLEDFGERGRRHGTREVVALSRLASARTQELSCPRFPRLPLLHVSEGVCHGDD